MNENGAEPLAGKWFFPITQRIELFENQSDVFQEFGEMTQPSSPDWMVQCAWTQMKPYREMSGLEQLDRIRARHVGAMIGSKASMCKRLAGGNLSFNKLSNKRQRKLQEVLGQEAVGKAKAIWARFATEIQPEFQKLRRFAMDVAACEDMYEQIQFHQGIANGLGFMDRIAQSTRSTSKRDADHRRRSVVCMFAIEHWEIIEAAKKDISWSDLVDQFDCEYGEHIVIDEETFKKILQRSGLTIGKVGRPSAAWLR